MTVLERRMRSAKREEAEVVTALRSASRMTRVGKGGGGWESTGKGTKKKGEEGEKRKKERRAWKKKQPGGNESEETHSGVKVGKDVTGERVSAKRE